jgi:Coenzyme PQQ synthesis protein D (PqqD)
MPSGSERIRSTHMADGGIVMNIDKGKMYSLNASGSAIFQLLEKGLDDEAIVTEFVRRFEIPSDVARRDLQDFREALRSHALVPKNALPSLE